jgi:hypothetical protein
MAYDCGLCILGLLKCTMKYRLWHGNTDSLRYLHWSQDFRVFALGSHFCAVLED